MTLDLLLLQGKCNVDAVNKNKHSSLMLAMSEGRTAIVEYLVSKGMDVFSFVRDYVYPKPSLRTTRYCSTVSYALLHCQ